MNHIEEKTRYELDIEHRDRYNSVLYLTNRQVSWLTASIVLCSFFIFLAGYFLGQRKAIEQFNEAIDKDVLTDSAYAHLYTHYESPKNSFPDPLVEPAESVKPPEPKQHYAQLIGFGTPRAADRFVDRLQQKNIPVKVVERHSKTAQGKEIIWYQVVTERFSKKDDLIVFTQKIKKEERLNDIRIVSC